MTQQEFKAWFDGFTEAMEGPPNKKQWGRIKERVKEIDGAAITHPLFVDRYWQRYGTPYYPWYTVCTSGSTGYNISAVDNLSGQSFNSSQALLALGKADYEGLA